MVAYHVRDVGVGSSSLLYPTQMMDEEPQLWFAMRATYRCEMAMKEKLEAARLTCFLPLIIHEKKVGLRKKRVWAPAINSLIFVYGQKSRIQAFKDKEPRLQYICCKAKRKALDGSATPITYMKPIVVPEEQMAAFIKVFEDGNYELTDNEDIINSIKPGQQVRVVEGPLAGLVGTFQRIKGHRSKMFVISIENVACIGTTIVSPAMVEALS